MEIVGIYESREAARRKYQEVKRMRLGTRYFKSGRVLRAHAAGRRSMMSNVVPKTCPNRKVDMLVTEREHENVQRHNWMTTWTILPSRPPTEKPA